MAAKKSGSTMHSPSTRRNGPSTRVPDAIGMLRADHEKVTEMFDRYEKLRTEEQKEDLAREICAELTVHTRLEEEIFYPAARGAIDDVDLLDEATVEHQSAKELIAQIEASGAGDDLFDAKVRVLGEYVKHHIKEEQNELFPEVKKSDLDLKALGQQMRDRKAQLQ